MLRGFLTVAALLLLTCGVVAIVQALTDGDQLLLFLPANLLPLSRPFVRGSDLPALLTWQGATLVYIVRGSCSAAPHSSSLRDPDFAL